MQVAWAALDRWKSTGRVQTINRRPRSPVGGGPGGLQTWRCATPARARGVRREDLSGFPGRVQLKLADMAIGSSRPARLIETYWAAAKAERGRGGRKRNYLEVGAWAKVYASEDALGQEQECSFTAILADPRRVNGYFGPGSSLSRRALPRTSPLIDHRPYRRAPTDNPWRTVIAPLRWTTGPRLGGLAVLNPPAAALPSPATRLMGGGPG